MVTESLVFTLKLVGSALGVTLCAFLTAWVLLKLGGFEP